MLTGPFWPNVLESEDAVWSGTPFEVRAPMLDRRMVQALTSALPDRQSHVVADAAYAGRALRGLPDRVSWTTRLRKDAALFELAPPRTGKRGRPRVTGARLGSLESLARTLEFIPTTVCRYGTSTTVHVATVYRMVAKAHRYVFRLTERSFRRLKAGRYLVQVRVGPSRTALGPVTSRQVQVRAAKHHTAR